MATTTTATNTKSRTVSAGQLTASVISVPKYLLTLPNGEHCTVEFIPCDGFPGFTHRVAFNGVLVPKWLSADFRPTAKSAVDMADMILTERDSATTIAGE